MLELTLYVLMEVILYSIGRVVIPIISLGRARVVRTREFFAGQFVAYDEAGKMVVPAWGASVVGVLTLVGLIVLWSTLSR